MSVKMKINLETLTQEEALALVIFLIEARNLPRNYSLAHRTSAAPAGVDASDESSGSDGGSDSSGDLAGVDAPVGTAEGQGNKKTRKRVAKEPAKFLLRNEATGVEVACDSGRTGDVDVARGYIETWIRDAKTPEAVEQLAKMAESFVTTCLSSKEQRALARIVAETLGTFTEGRSPEAPASEDPKPEGVGATEEAVKEAGKALATARGIAAVTTVLAKFNLKSFKDMREEQRTDILAALKEAM